MTIEAKRAMKKRMFKWGVPLLVLAIGIPVGYFAGRARAAGIPAATPMVYSGLLTDAAGTPMTGSVPIQLSLFDAVTAGNLLCFTPSAAQTLTAGAFQITLPDTCTPVVRNNPDLWVEITVSGVTIGRTKLGAVPYAIVAAVAVEATCGPTTGPAMVDTGAGFCMDAADRAETVYGSSAGTCAVEGKVMCSFIQLCTARARNVGALAATPVYYRTADLMYFSGDTAHYFGGGNGANGLKMPAACSTLVAPGPNGGPTSYRCCRGKG
jgi:hypothetical protein